MADDEIVALVDDAGEVVGTAPRREVRARNLPHMATAVLLRDPVGRVYVHRRTVTKDVFPGMHDCWAGGVVLADEDPGEAAERELAEELGVTGVPLRRILTGWYADDSTRYLAFVYEAEWDGPVAHQPEEVDWGTWMPLEELVARLEDESWPFVPDGRQLLGRYLALRDPSVAADEAW